MLALQDLLTKDLRVVKEREGLKMTPGFFPKELKGWSCT